MIQMGTVLFSADNSGARTMRCIKVIGSSKKRFAHVAEIIKVSIKTALPNSKVKKGEVFNAVVVRTRYPIKRPDGSCITFGRNSAVLLNDKKEPLGTRIFGPLPRELRAKKFTKILSLSPEVI